VQQKFPGFLQIQPKSGLNGFNTGKVHTRPDKSPGLLRFFIIVKVDALKAK